MTSHTRLIFWTILLLALPWAGPAGAQTEGITTTRLTDGLYLFSTDQGAYTTNSLALVGKDGLLLVDTQARGRDAMAMKEAVDALGYGAPKYIILTHRHVEHIGGNELYGADPVVIAHALLPEKLISGGFLFDEWGPETMPDITVADSLTLFFNGEEIRIVAMGVSHDDNEIAVHFKKNKVVHLSSVVNGFNFPSVDGDGDPLGFPDAVGQAMKLFPREVTVVSGHNPPGEWSQFPAYQAMHIQAQEAVREALEDGKSLTQMQEENLLAPWEQYAGSYVSANEWIEELVTAMTEEPDPRPTVHARLFEVWKAEGAEAAVKEYFRLFEEDPEQYTTDALTLLEIGYHLSSRKLYGDASAFYRGSLEAYPDAPLAYYAHYLLAQALHEVGEDEEALEHCDRALELQPGFGAASELSDTIRGHASRVAYGYSDRDSFPDGIGYDQSIGDVLLGSLWKRKIVRL